MYIRIFNNGQFLTIHFSDYFLILINSYQHSQIAPLNRVVKYMMFLASNLTQIWLISNSGNKLIEAVYVIRNLQH